MSSHETTETQNDQVSLEILTPKNKNKNLRQPSYLVTGSLSSYKVSVFI
jgi:hypothetical protein